MAERGGTERSQRVLPLVDTGEVSKFAILKLNRMSSSRKEMVSSMDDIQL